MNKSGKVIMIMGIGTVLLLFFVFFLLIQEVPEVEELVAMSTRIQTIFPIEKVTIRRELTPRGLQYFLNFKPKKDVSKEEIEKLFDLLGTHVWDHYPKGQPPSKVWVIYEEQTGGGCVSGVRIQKQQVMPSKRHLKKFENSAYTMPGNNNKNDKSK